MDWGRGPPYNGSWSPKTTREKEKNEMKKNVLSLLLVGSLCLGLGACGQKTVETPAPVETQGNEVETATYTGTASGRNGEVKVSVTFAGDEITEVKVVEHKETEGIADAALELMPQWMQEHQTVGVDMVGGATVTSAAIRMAATDAISQAGKNTADYSARPEAKAPEKLEDLTTDVVVVGGGLSGMMAALSARENGAEVVVVEKHHMTGGSGALASAYMLISGSEAFAKEHPDFDQSVDAFVEFAREKSEPNNTGYEFNGEYLRFIEENVGEMVDYLLSIGMTCEFRTSATAVASWTGSGAGMMKTLTEEAEKQGVTILTGTEAVSLLTEGQEVTGVSCVSGGDELTIHAGKVILATGGSGYAKDAEFTNFPADSKAFLFQGGCSGDTGDGQRMAAEVGAEIEGALRIKQAGVDFNQAIRNTTTKRPKNAECLAVNAEGERFIRENGMNTDTLLAAGSPAYWLIVDTANPEIEESMRAGVEAGAPIRYGATIEELAESIKVDAGTLRATFDRYQELCQAGEDTDFGKKAEQMIPYTGEKGYYAYNIYAGGWGTMGGGIVTDNIGHALTVQGEVIPNLFAVGECSDGHIFGDNYVGGMSESVFTTAGRLAGRAAAQELAQ